MANTEKSMDPDLVSPTHMGPCSVFLKALKLTNFRSYGSAHLQPDPDKPLVVLKGANGSGKTNVLEAISYLAPGRGLRGASLGDITRRNGASPWAVAATLTTDGEDIRVGTGLDPISDSTNPRRIVRIDGETMSGTNGLAERWSVSWLTPQMDRLFLEGPSSRRKFLDRLVIGLYPDHSRQVGAYERVMRERNKLLSEQGMSADMSWVSAIEARMAEHAVAVAVHRLDFAGQLAGQLSAQKASSAFPRAVLAIDGWLEGLLADDLPAAEAENAMRERLSSERSADARAGRTSVGVHKTDLLVTHCEKDMPAELCSTGEQKALLIGLILANARLLAAQRGHAPIMLLDEIAAHLDAERRTALFQELGTLGGQCWLTGTDRSLFDGTEELADYFDVESGTLSRAA